VFAGGSTRRCRPIRTATPAINHGNRRHSEAPSEFGALFLNGAQRSVNRKVQGSNPWSRASLLAITLLRCEPSRLSCPQQSMREFTVTTSAYDGLVLALFSLIAAEVGVAVGPAYAHLGSAEKSWDYLYLHTDDFAKRHDRNLCRNGMTGSGLHQHVVGGVGRGLLLGQKV